MSAFDPKRTIASKVEAKFRVNQNIAPAK